MNLYSYMIGLSAFFLFFSRSVLAACLCGPGVPCELSLSGTVTSDTDYIACERVFLDPGFYVDPAVDVRIEAGLEISFDVLTGADQGGMLAADIVPALACAGDSDSDQFNQCLDCDDTRDDVYPGGPEFCDGLDNNCDGEIDNGLTPPACSLTQGVCSGTEQSCGGGAGWLACGSAEYGEDFELVEVSCDGLDNDCDGVIDAGCAPMNTAPYMVNTGSIFITSCGQVTVTMNELGANDLEDGPGDLTYTIIDPGVNGLFYLSGAAAFSFTQVDINNGLVSFGMCPPFNNFFQYEVNDSGGLVTGVKLGNILFSSP